MSAPAGAPIPMPSLAEIPLPPGFTLEQFMTLQGQLVTIAIVTVAVFGILAWDYFALLPSEISLYKSRDKKIWRTPTTWFFVILRYSGFLATTPSLFFTAVQSNHCQTAVNLSQAGVILAVASSGVIFCYRVFAIWSGNKIVKVFVIVTYIGMMSCWIAVTSQFKAVNGPPTAFGSNCQMLPIVSWAPISYASSVAFDSIILGLTLFKLHGNLATTKSKVGKQIYKDNLVYFAITAVTNITVLSIQALGSSSNMIKPNAVPFSTLMTVTMGSRVYLNLKLLDKRREREPAGIPMPILSGSSGNTASDPQFSTFHAKAFDSRLTTTSHTPKNSIDARNFMP